MDNLVSKTFLENKDNSNKPKSILGLIDIRFGNETRLFVEFKGKESFVLKILHFLKFTFNLFFIETA